MKTKTLIKSILSKVKAAAVAAYLLLALKVTPVLAADNPADPNVNGSNGASGWEAFQKLVERGFEGAGIVFIVLGALKVYPVIKTGEQNPEAISDAIKNFIIAAMCIGISVVIGWFKGGLTI